MRDWDACIVSSLRLLCKKASRLTYRDRGTSGDFLQSYAKVDFTLSLSRELYLWELWGARRTV